MYQAYAPDIAEAAVKAQHFVPPFKLTRMTWIKPSFYWMMYRCGYATKSGQERVLAIDVLLEDFFGALSAACLASYIPGHFESIAEWRAALNTSPVRIQWDPERDWQLNAINGVRSIQIGLGGEIVQQYASRWNLRITDVTETVHRIAALRSTNREPSDSPARQEQCVPMPAALVQRIVPRDGHS